jgi:hypothetical protein
VVSGPQGALWSQSDAAGAEGGAAPASSSNLREFVGTSPEAFRVVEGLSAQRAPHDTMLQGEGALLSELLASAAHWTQLWNSRMTLPEEMRGAQRSLCLVTAWLGGMVPPPRCRAAVEDACMMCVQEAGSYCTEVHACMHACGCAERRSQVRLLPPSILHFLQVGFGPMSKRM